MSCEGLPGTDAGETGHVYELDRKTVRKWFGNGRYARVGTIGEGSCFFHSLAFAMNLENLGKDYASMTIPEKKAFVHAWRKAFARSLTQDRYNTLNTKKTFSELKAALADPHAWADEAIIKFVAKQLNTNIMFVDMRSKKAYCGIHNEAVLYRPDTESINTILVAWVNHQHFEPIVRIVDLSGNLRTMFQASDPFDKALLEKLMTSYSDACGL